MLALRINSRSADGNQKLTNYLLVYYLKSNIYYYWFVIPEAWVGSVGYNYSASASGIINCVMKNVQKVLINFANFACKSAVLRPNYTTNTGAKLACKKIHAKIHEKIHANFWKLNVRFYTWTVCIKWLLSLAEISEAENDDFSPLSHIE